MFLTFAIFNDKIYSFVTSNTSGGGAGQGEGVSTTFVQNGYKSEIANLLSRLFSFLCLKSLTNSLHSRRFRNVRAHGVGERGRREDIVREECKKAYMYLSSKEHQSCCETAGERKQEKRTRNREPGERRVGKLQEAGKERPGSRKMEQGQLPNSLHSMCFHGVLCAKEECHFLGA